MRNNWFFFMDPEGGSSDIFPMDPLVPHSFGAHFLSHIALFVDNSRYLYVPGSLALQETFNFVSKFAGALLIWLSRGSSSKLDYRISGSSHGSHPSNLNGNTQVKWVTSCGQNFAGFFCNHRAKGKSGIPFVLGKISSFSMRQLCKDSEHLGSLRVLSLAAALVPPLDNFCPDVLAVPGETGAIDAQKCLNQRPCEVEHQGCSDISFECLTWTRHVVEPTTGIEFPSVLDNIVAGEDNSSFASEVYVYRTEVVGSLVLVVLWALLKAYRRGVLKLDLPYSWCQVLVGTGSRVMKIIRIKSLKVYAFGFYVHPFDVCEKLGPKYASIPVYKLNKSRDFYEDLLREDINMTVRLVVSCNGIKISTVRDAFEKSLRARLVKTNPDTDYSCLQTFGSIFSQDIPLHVGATINFRRTGGGCLITEIEGNQLQSKDLCRAFFDMYIGDVPVCKQTKEEIGNNVASIMQRC